MDFSLSESRQALRESIVTVRARRAERGCRRARPRAGLLARAVAEMRRDGHPGPAGAGGVRRQRARPAHLRDRASRRSATAATTAASCSRCAPTCSPAWCRSGSTATRSRSAATCPGSATARSIGVHAMTEPRLGLRRLRAAHARRAGRRRLPHQRHQDVHLQRARSPTWSSCSRSPTRRRASTAASPRSWSRAARPASRSSRKFEKMGLRTSPIGELVFEDVRVRHDAVLGGGRALARRSSRARWTGSASASSRATSAPMRAPAGDARSRTRARAPSSGRRSGSSRPCRHRIADMKVQPRGGAPADLPRGVAARPRRAAPRWTRRSAKLFVSESLVQAALATVQMHRRLRLHDRVRGGAALRDAVGSTIYSGTSPRCSATSSPAGSGQRELSTAKSSRSAGAGGSFGENCARAPCERDRRIERRARDGARRATRTPRAPMLAASLAAVAPVSGRLVQHQAAPGLAAPTRTTALDVPRQQRAQVDDLDLATLAAASSAAASSAQATPTP